MHSTAVSASHKETPASQACYAIRVRSTRGNVCVYGKPAQQAYRRCSWRGDKEKSQNELHIYTVCITHECVFDNPQVQRGAMSAIALWSTLSNSNVAQGGDAAGTPVIAAAAGLDE